MLRVLQVFANLDRGGAETMIMNYYRAIDKNQVQFDFVSHFNDGAYESEIKEMGGKIFRIPRFKGYNILSYMKAWDNFFKAHPEYKIIHVHCFKIAGLILYVAKRNGVKMRIVHSHIANSKYKFYVKAIVFLLNKLAMSASTHLFACGVDAGKFLFKKKSFVVLNNAINSSNFRFDFSKRYMIRKSLNLDGCFVIGHVGRFFEQKNHKFIIEIFEQIVTRNKNVRLLLIGSGILVDDIKKLVNDKHLNDYVIFTGVRSDIPELMMAMDVFLFPSLYEGLPVTVIETQAAGLKTFMSDTITEEVKISPLISVISLKNNAEFWAEEILKCSDGYERKDMSNVIVKEGYDIFDNAKKLMDFYLGARNG